MKKSTFIIAIVSCFILILLSGWASAITGKIGNGKMILNAEVGDTIDRTIRVINDNNQTLNITLFASGDLAEDITIIDSNFILLAGEEKKARFTIEIKNPGNTDNRINVQFQPLIEEESGVGLSAQIIINAVGEGELENEDIESDETPGLTGDAIFKNPDGSENSSKIIIALAISTFVLLVLLLILLYYASKKKKPKQNEKADEIKKEVKKTK
ncbi:MAG: hypothetical protein WC533_01130 [Candidatus Pacearchaeota archaeon]